MNAAVCANFLFYEMDGACKARKYAEKQNVILGSPAAAGICVGREKRSHEIQKIT